MLLWNLLPDFSVKTDLKYFDGGCRLCGADAACGLSGADQRAAPGGVRRKDPAVFDPHGFAGQSDLYGEPAGSLRF